MDNCLIRPQMDVEHMILGHCFNAYTGGFITKQFFKHAPVPLIQKADKYQFVYESKQNKKELNSLMDISAELEVTLACVPLNIQGKAKYFKDTKKHYDSQYAKVHYQWRKEIHQITKENELLPDMEKVQELKKMGATHILQKIVYGGRAQLNFESKVSEDLSDQKIHGDLAVKFEMAMLKIAGKASVDINDSELDIMNSKFLKYEGEFQGPTSQTIDGIQKWFSDLVKQQKTLNAGQISYQLVPINLYVSTVDIIVHQLNTNLLTDISNYQKIITETRQMYTQTLYIHNEKLTAFTSNKYVEWLNQKQKSYDTKTNDFNSKITNELMEYKKTGDSQKMRKVIGEATQAGTFNEKYIASNALGYSSELLWFMKSLEKMGCKWLPRTKNNVEQDFRLNNFDFVALFLFQSDQDEPQNLSRQQVFKYQEQTLQFLELAQALSPEIGKTMDAWILNIDAYGPKSQWKTVHQQQHQYNTQPTLVKRHVYTDETNKLTKYDDNVIGDLKIRLPFKFLKSKNFKGDVQNNRIQTIKQMGILQYYSFKCGILNGPIIELTKNGNINIGKSSYHLSSINFVFGTPLGLAEVCLSIEELKDVLPDNISSQIKIIIPPKINDEEQIACETFQKGMEIRNLLKTQAQNNINQVPIITTKLQEFKQHLRGRQIKTEEMKLMTSMREGFTETLFLCMANDKLRDLAIKFIEYLKNNTDD